jgi:ABC-type protease/lipase transport system fused ATPase/permease subunit
VAPVTRQLLIAAFLWAPVIAVYVLLGYALSWWLPAIWAAGSAVFIGLALVYRRRLRRLRSDPDAMRAHEEQAYRRAVRWSKVWGLLFAGMMMFLVVFVLVVVIAEHV